MDTLNKFHNGVALLGWLTVQTLTTSLLVGDREAIRQPTAEAFTMPILVCQILQALQVLDIIFILLGTSKGSILGAIAQIAGRLLVTLVYMSPEIAPVSIANVLIAWSLAETNRYLYYLFKNPLTTWLRYNSFLVLYPVGIYGEMTLINDFISKNALSENQVLAVRLSQAAILLGGTFLYVYMLGNRSKRVHRKHSTKTEAREVDSSGTPANR